MKALVVGGAGFVGKFLIEALVRVGVETHATTLPNVPIFVSDDVVTHYLDITAPDEIEQLLCEIKPDVIYHLAAQSSVRISWEKPRLTAEVNAVGAVNLFEGIRRVCPSARTLIIGSSEEYGKINYDEAVKENAIPQPGNPYALTKFFQERLAKLYADAYGLNFIMTRSFNHFGPYQSEQFVVADFCSQVAAIENGEKEPIIRVGNLDAYRDFTDVRDVVEAYLILSEKGERGEVYNVGSGECLRIRDILELILSLSTKKIKVEIDKQKFRPTDVPRIRADVSKLMELGWKPKIPVRETIKDTLSFYRGKQR